jgi:hypothetical protein
VTDDWTPDNLPIALMSRSLLTATKATPFRIGTARVTAQDEDSLLALDKLLDLEVDDDGESVLPGRRETGQETDWVGDLTGMPYQISYYFPSRVRPIHAGTGKYGSPGLTFKALYEALCDGFNGGRRFIEDYFLSCFRDRMAPMYEEAVHDLKQRIADEAQRRRGAHRAYLSNFEEWVGPWVTQVFKQLGAATKQDIVQCLAIGKIPLQKTALHSRTILARERLGIPSTEVFYATGRLINSIQVSVILLDHETAEREEEL